MTWKTETDLSTEWGPRENLRIIKNVAVVSIAFMLLYTAVFGTYNLQSSINVEEGLGTASMAALYIAVLFSSFFLPVVIIEWLGTKWAIICCFACFIPYIVAQLHPTFYTLIPTAALSGLACAPLWCAMCTYITTVSEANSKITKTSTDVYIARHFGRFYMVFHINQVWGNLISSAVLQSGDNVAAVTSMNASQIPEMCGANFLPSADASEAILPQPPEKIQTLVGIFLVFMVGAMLLAGFALDSPRRYKSKSSNKDEESIFSLLFKTTKLVMEPNQLLMTSASIFLGLHQGFVTADLTVSFVSCAIGPGTVGYVMMSSGAADACGCCITGFLVNKMGRPLLVCSALVLNTGLFITMLLYRPNPDEVYVIYLIAVVAGLCNSVWLVQTNAYYGILFPGREEPAFATFRLFEAIGFIIIFTISPYYRTSSKIYLLFSMMCLGSTGYFITECRRRKTNKCFEVTINNSVEKEEGCDNLAYS